MRNKRVVHALILAGGSGERMGLSIPKQFIKIGGKTVFEHIIQVFEKSEFIDDIIIVVNPNYRSFVEELILRNKFRKVSKILNGGSSRRESSFIGVMSIDNDEDLVLIHDAVRPFLNDNIIFSCVKALEEFDAVDVAIPSDDTIIKVNEKGLIEEIPDRNLLRRGQTPQGFKVGVIKKAHNMALENQQLEFTDDCGLIVRFGLADVYVVTGDRFNIKLTFPEDIYLADKIFQVRSQTIMDAEISKLDMKDKVVVVFGASRGIGKSIIEASNKFGAKAYGFSRSSGVDVSDFSLVLSALEKVKSIEGKIDYVVNTAAILRTGTLFSRSIDGILEEIKTNYIGSVNVVKASIPFLEETKGNILLFTSSSYTRGRALYSIYSSTKAAIVNFVQGMAEELSVNDIRINVLNPERTATPMRFENFGKEPLDSLLNPEFVALVALKVLASNMTGQVIDVRKEYEYFKNII